MKKVFCIIVHFGSPHITQQLVSKLLEGSSLPHRIVVVDQATQPYVPSVSGSIVHISRISNNGYAAGIAHGLDVVASQAQEDDIVIVCNNDVHITSETIQLLREWWSHQDRPVLAGAKMGTIDLFTGRAHIGRSRTAFSLPYVHGSFLVATRTTWQKLQPLPEHYFMYWEDVAISIMAHQRGIELQALPDIGVRHDDSGSPRTVDQLYFLVRNGAAVLETKTWGAWPLYWQFANELRLLYHHFKGHKHIARALADRKTL